MVLLYYTKVSSRPRVARNRSCSGIARILVVCMCVCVCVRNLKMQPFIGSVGVQRTIELKAEFFPLFTVVESNKRINKQNK